MLVHGNNHGIRMHGIMTSQHGHIVKAHGIKMTSHGIAIPMSMSNHTIMSLGIMLHHGIHHMIHGIPSLICLRCASNELRSTGTTMYLQEWYAQALVIGQSQHRASDWTAGLETKGILAARIETHMKYMRIPSGDLAAKHVAGNLDTNVLLWNVQLSEIAVHLVAVLLESKTEIDVKPEAAVSLDLLRTTSEDVLDLHRVLLRSQRVHGAEVAAVHLPLLWAPWTYIHPVTGRIHV